MMYARDHRAAARSALSLSWGQGVLVTFLLLLASAVSGWLIPVGIVIIPIISWSYTIIFLGVMRGEHIEAKHLTLGFNRMGKVWFLNFFMFLFVFLWTLLLIIPGIIKSFSYAMAPYILVDNPHMTPREAITESRRMMDGHKWELFCLNFSFIGWELLATLSLGIGYLWLTPYIYTANASFYENLRIAGLKHDEEIGAQA